MLSVEAIAKNKIFEKKHMTNFYALDSETTGFETNEPIQIAVILFRNGVEVDKFNEYYVPRSSITDDAFGSHGLTKTKLLCYNASYWTKKSSDGLADFLGWHPDYPIVSHSVDYDFKDVLRPAYLRVCNQDRLPKADRWVCTWNLSFYI